MILFNRSQSNIPDIEKEDNNTPLGDRDEIDCDDTSITSMHSPPPSDRDSKKPKQRKMEKVSKILAENRESRLKLLETLKDVSKKKEDEIDAFYRSIALSVKSLPPLLKSEIKMKHLQTLHDIELKYMQSQSSQYHQPYYPQQQLLQEPPLTHQTRTYQELGQLDNQSYSSQSTDTQSFYENNLY